MSGRLLRSSKSKVQYQFVNDVKVKIEKDEETEIEKNKKRTNLPSTPSSASNKKQSPKKIKNLQKSSNKNVSVKKEKLDVGKAFNNKTVEFDPLIVKTENGEVNASANDNFVICSSSSSTLINLEKEETECLTNSIQPPGPPAKPTINKPINQISNFILMDKVDTNLEESDSDDDDSIAEVEVVEENIKIEKIRKEDNLKVKIIEKYDHHYKNQNNNNNCKKGPIIPKIIETKSILNHNKVSTLPPLDLDDIHAACKKRIQQLEKEKKELIQSYESRIDYLKRELKEQEFQRSIKRKNTIMKNLMKKRKM